MTETSVSPISIPSRNILFNHFPQLYTFWKFSRPHTIIGTSLSVFSLWWLVGSMVNNLAFFPLLGTLVTCLWGNVYIVGLNQLEDIAIDRINKPHLPLAAEEFSLAQGRWIVGICGLLAMLSAALQGGWLLVMLTISLAIGTAYSLPPIRLKRSPFLASLSIFTVRGLVVNLGLYLHFSHANFSLRSNPLVTVPVSVWALTLFIVVFTLAIAIFKDIPDMEGDRQYNISTFTIRLGAKAVFDLSRWILTFCYLGLAIGAIFYLKSANLTFLISSHLTALTLFWWASFRVDLSDRQRISQFYQLIWKLFFLEYLIFPTAYWFSALLR